MATQINHPEEKPIAAQSRNAGDRTEQFWQKNGRTVLTVLAAALIIVGGFLLYRSFFVAPEEQKAAQAAWKAEQYYRLDSANLALNGDGSSVGFLKIISRYGSTKTGALAKFYAGSCYLKIGDFNNAIKYLKDYSTSDKLIEVRAAGLLGDAYAESGKKNEAVEQYRKAGTIFEADNVNSPEYLFRAGLLYSDLGKNKEAIEMFQLIKDKYSASERGTDIDKYLAKLGSVK
jgi:tetratricopeptide (TPR) repeat protein